jgi:hypothetical protein
VSGRSFTEAVVSSKWHPEAETHTSRGSEKKRLGRRTGEIEGRGGVVTVWKHNKFPLCLQISFNEVVGALDFANRGVCALEHLTPHLLFDRLVPESGRWAQRITTTRKHGAEVETSKSG